MRARTRLATLSAVLLLACQGGDAVGPPEIVCTIDRDAFFAGSGRDQIVALELPEIVIAADAFLDDATRVLGVEFDGESRAYPLYILWWHEIINDIVGDTRVVISYCPLTGSGLAFNPFVEGDFRTFGVSGLLVENNLVMFDRQTASLWNQMLMGSQCGPHRGAGLERLPVVETSWKQWRRGHPRTTVITENTGIPAPYGFYPYGDYDRPTNPATLFPGSEYSDARPPKEPVLGVREGDAARAYPFGVLADHGESFVINDELGGRPIAVTYMKDQITARAFDRRVGERVLTFTVTNPLRMEITDEQTGTTWDWAGRAIDGPLVGEHLTPLEDAWTLFWFAWSVFYPETELFLGSREQGAGSGEQV